MGIAFVKCERVNNSISPKCQLCRAPNAVKTIGGLEVVSAEERLINCPGGLPMALWPGLFVHSEAMPSFGKQYLSTIRNFQGARFSVRKLFKKIKKKEKEREK